MRQPGAPAPSSVALAEDRSPAVLTATTRGGGSAATMAGMSLPAWRAEPSPTGPLPRILPAVMLALATMLCLGTAALFTPSTSPATYLTIFAGGLLYLWWWEERGVHERVGAVLAFAAHCLACVGLVALNPMYGFYAFIGYFDAVRVFTGRALWVAIVAVASSTALSQSGGIHGLWTSPPLFALVLAINVALSGTMITVEKRREEAVARREETVARLEEAQRENAALQARLLTQARESGILEERARLSREIHDTVAQGLVGVITQLEALQAHDASHGADDTARRRIERAGQAARDSLAEARRAVAALASPHLDDTDLPTALHRLVASWGEASGIEARLVVDGRTPSGGRVDDEGVGAPATGALDSPHDADLLRIAQEALANAARHSGATRATVTLTYVEDQVRLDIRDDGRGFDPATTRYGRGIAGMRERLTADGGTLDVETRPGAGCVVSAAVPT